jgi:hypothetical protein
MFHVLFTFVFLFALLAHGPAKSTPARDLSKDGIERPTVRQVASTSAPAANKVDNPRVQPGLVHWRASFEEACEASRKSGKPVLLFHMMGNLDQQFC